MTGWWKRFTEQLAGREPVPDGFEGTLEGDERVLASASTGLGGVVLATQLGLWLPDVEVGHRRVGWHLVSKATWRDGVLTVVESVAEEPAEDVQVLTDQAPRRYALEQPGRLPEIVHKRVTGSIQSRHHRELPGGGAWFVQRRIPGRTGVLLQVRPEPGTDGGAVTEVATAVAAQIRRARDASQE
ncbi:hypothetical protein C1701_19010 [Actinoalloteichus sp. AHMU CJ021]|uniref:Uncharacterized protein n=1 Tax=Actinoalloteichus caeruleus DSM 43889 TaxID=1120930 RepID=A0ABT1JPJ0_ACTCY|nr:hypothetical protein [Actinoalloteichus caeruleus]AUS80079.1 hypothetical protein C1701_19010 [Actinoalloteichus sp. AHMU CJ021]MCP2334277.1 hypothetical protein [Actinoalloteichus caeruleus DSM 43889]